MTSFSGDLASFVTIGHANRPVREVVDMLVAAKVGLLADVRAFPRSRRNPAFNSDVFAPVLAEHQIGYRHFPDLGGRRPRQKDVDPALNAYWREDGFHNYADYALGEIFAHGLAALEGLGREQRVAIMCAEAVWWRCHRRIITDYLLAHGFAVDHLMGPGQVQQASLTPEAELKTDGKLIYPADDLLKGLISV